MPKRTRLKRKGRMPKGRWVVQTKEEGKWKDSIYTKEDLSKGKFFPSKAMALRAARGWYGSKVISPWVYRVIMK